MDTFSSYVFVWLSSALVFLLTIYTIRSWTKRSRLPPGPKTVPLFGNLMQIGETPYETFAKWTQIYGNIFTIYLGRQPTVVLNGFSTVREALLQNATAFAGRPDSFLFDQVSGDKSLLASSYSTRVKFQRNICLNITRKLLHKDNHYIRSLYEQQADDLCKALDAETRQNGAFHPHEIIAKASCATQYQVCFGKSRTNEEFRDHETLYQNADAFTKFAGLGNIVDLYPWVRYLIPSKWSQFVKAAKYITILSKKHFESYCQALKNRDSDEIYVLEEVNALLASKQQDIVRNGAGFDHMKALVPDLLGAGAETIATTIEWAIFLLASHPEVHQKLRHEIERIFGDGRIPYEMREKLPYTQSTIAEILRHSCIVPLALPHSTCEDVEFHGYHIPKDTRVFVNLWSVHMDENLWKNPEVFCPERFLTEDGILDKNQIRKTMPFSLGRRMCVGKRIAEMELFTFITAMARRCSFKMIHPISSNRKFGLTLKPPDYKVAITVGQ